MIFVLPKPSNFKTGKRVVTPSRGDGVSTVKYHLHVVVGYDNEERVDIGLIKGYVGRLEDEKLLARHSSEIFSIDELSRDVEKIPEWWPTKNEERRDHPLEPSIYRRYLQINAGIPEGTDLSRLEEAIEDLRKRHMHSAHLEYATTKGFSPPPSPLHKEKYISGLPKEDVLKKEEKTS